MAVYSIKRAEFNKLINLSKKTYDVFGPVKKDSSISYEQIDDPNNIAWTGNSYVPPKHFFMPHKEELFRFEDGKFTTSSKKIRQRIILGLKMCDLNAMSHHKTLYIDNYNDEHYKMLFDQTLLVGYLCRKECSPYAFCGSLDLKRFYDLMIIDLEQKNENFLIDIGSEKGQRFIDANKKFFKKEEKTIPEADFKMKFADRLKKLDISKHYDHKDWHKGVDLCLSCGACTSLCPSCYCFELKDEPSLKDSSVSKVKELSSCQLESFSKVAGNVVFRKDRSQRFKHRIYHQLDYFKKRYGINLCTGCGRCIQYCPTRIDFVKIINEMA